MTQLHFDVNQLNIGESMGVLHLFVWNYVNYANMEGFRRDSHILTYTLHAYSAAGTNGYTTFRD